MNFTLFSCNVKSISNNGPHMITSTQAIINSTTINGIVTPKLNYNSRSTNLEDKVHKPIKE